MVVVEDGNELSDSYILADVDAVVCNDAAVFVDAETVAEGQFSFGKKHDIIVDNHSAVTGNFSVFEDVKTAAFTEHRQAGATEFARIIRTRDAVADDAARLVEYGFVAELHFLRRLESRGYSSNTDLQVV